MNKTLRLALCLAVASTAAFARSHHHHHSAPPPPPPPGAYNGYNGYNGGFAQPAPPPPPAGYGQGRQVQPSRHGHGGTVVAEYSAGGEAKEVAIGGGRSTLVIEVVSGSITINTIVLRRGGQKQSITVAARFNQGQRHVIPIDGAVTGVRISDGGKGRYRVYAR